MSRRAPSAKVQANRELFFNLCMAGSLWFAACLLPR